MLPYRSAPNVEAPSVNEYRDPRNERFEKRLVPVQSSRTPETGSYFLSNTMSGSGICALYARATDCFFRRAERKIGREWVFFTSTSTLLGVNFILRPKSEAANPAR